mmetsp:Transcript_8730/g.26447  ORF Transcript_8730/g.26447 Transcript_8730/m.26447 type:complete len:247 (-) Transcript_8730:408-1148(-)
MINLEGNLLRALLACGLIYGRRIPSVHLAHNSIVGQRPVFARHGCMQIVADRQELALGPLKWRSWRQHRRNCGLCVCWLRLCSGGLLALNAWALDCLARRTANNDRSLWLLLLLVRGQCGLAGGTWAHVAQWLRSGLAHAHCQRLAGCCQRCIHTCCRRLRAEVLRELHRLLDGLLREQFLHGGFALRGAQGHIQSGGRRLAPVTARADAPSWVGSCERCLDALIDMHCRYHAAADGAAGLPTVAE